MSIKRLLTVVALWLQILTTVPLVNGQSRAKAAYLSRDIKRLTEIASEERSEESQLASEYIAMMDLDKLNFQTLSDLSSKASASQNKDLAKLFDDMISARQLTLMEELRGMTAEEVTKCAEQQPYYRRTIDDYAKTLSEGLDSLSYLELRYLRDECPVFDKSILRNYLNKRRPEISPILESKLKKYRDFEQKSMDQFAAVLLYEIMEGLQKQMKQFAVAYSMDQDMETATLSGVHSSYMSLLRKYWNEGFIYDYVLAQTKNYNEAINNAREEFLKNLGIKGRHQNVIQIPRVDTGISLPSYNFSEIARIHDDLNTSSVGSSIVSGLASFLTGGFIAGVGKSIYMSGKQTDAAKEEIRYRRANLEATYSNLKAQTESEVKKMLANMKVQQKNQSQSFYNYVLQNF